MLPTVVIEVLDYMISSIKLKQIRSPVGKDHFF